MSKIAARPSGRASAFHEHELIVSKTDLKGRITYCNDVFCRVAAMDERTLLGAPHSVIRHPEMPRAVFKLLWDTIQAGGEIFAYVLNLAANGDHYWVLAHVTPSYDAGGTLVGYHSNRRKPRPEPVETVTRLYRELRAIEEQPDRKAGLQASVRHLNDTLASQGIGYDRFVLSL